MAPPNFESGTYRGHAEYLRLIERWGAAWEEMRTEPRGMEVAGEWVLARVDYIGRGKDSGGRVGEQPVDADAGRFR